MENFKVGIIVPVYNSYPYFKKCIDSIINQTYKNIEICIVNDGSTDKDTLNFLKDIGDLDNRIVVINKPNGGSGSARNLGIDYFNNMKNATDHLSRDGGGVDYVMFVDGDDYLNITCIEECLKYSNGMDIVWFHQGFVEFRLQYKKRMTITPIQWIDRLKEKNINYFWFGHGGLIDFSFLISSNIRFIEEYMHEDHAFGIQLFSSAKNIFVLPTHLYYYVPSQNSVTRPSAISGNVHIYPHIEYLTKYFKNSKDVRGYFGDISGIVIGSVILKYIDELTDKELKDKLFNTFTSYADNIIERCLRIKEDPLDYYKQAMLSNKMCDIEPTSFNDISKENLFLICRYAFIKKINELTSEIMGYKNKTIFLEQKIINLENNNVLETKLKLATQNLTQKTQELQTSQDTINYLNNQLNTLNTEINSMPIKKQSLEISNLEQDLINKKLKAQILEKELRYDYNAIQENKELKEQIKALQLIGKENIKQQSIYTAKSRIHNQLSYKLGQAMIENSKSIWGYIRMPYVLSYIKDMHKKEQIAYNEKIKTNPSLKLPPLESYPDYKEALKEKECLTYKLGEAMIAADKSPLKLGYLSLWFKCKNIQKEFKKR